MLFTDKEDLFIKSNLLAGHLISEIIESSAFLMLINEVKTKVYHLMKTIFV